jgi:uncharacterized protein (TIGR00251 family)
LTLPPYLQQEKSKALLLHLRVQPGASRSGWAGPHGDRYKLRLRSPPQDGKANRELLRFLSEALGVPKSDLELVRGQSSRNKTVRITGLSPDQLLFLLA